MSITRDAFVQDFSELLDDSSGAISHDTRLADLEDWDSLNVLMLITHVDEKFGVELPLDQLSSCECVSDIYALVESSLEESRLS